MKKSDLIITAVTLLAVVGVFVFLHYTMTVRPRQEAEKMRVLSDISMKVMQESQQKQITQIMEDSKKHLDTMFQLEKQKADMARIQKQLDASKAVLERSLSPSPLNSIGSPPNSPLGVTESPQNTASSSSAVKVFDGSGHPKSNGIRFRISCPSAWRSAEGTRPHIVQKFTSPDAHETFMIQVLPMPSDIPETPTKEDLDSIYSEEIYREFIPEGGRLLSSSRTKLDGEDCGMFETIYTTERAGISIVQRTVNFMLITKQGMLFLVGAAMAQPNETPSAEERFEKAKLQFVGIAGTLHLPDKWLQR